MASYRREKDGTSVSATSAESIPAQRDVGDPGALLLLTLRECPPVCAEAVGGLAQHFTGNKQIKMRTGWRAASSARKKASTAIMSTRLVGHGAWSV